MINSIEILSSLYRGHSIASVSIKSQKTKFNIFMSTTPWRLDKGPVFPLKKDKANYPYLGKLVEAYNSPKIRSLVEAQRYLERNNTKNGYRYRSV